MVKKKNKQLKVYSVRAEEEMMNLASIYKIDVAQAFRKTLENELAKKQGKCPTCGQKSKWEKLE